jgi:hypothetical protein
MVSVIFCGIIDGYLKQVSDATPMGPSASFVDEAIKDRYLEIYSNAYYLLKEHGYFGF